MRPSKAVLGLLPVGLGLVLATPLASSYSHSSPDVSLALEAVHTTALTPETTHNTQEDASDSLSGKTHVVVPCQGCLSDGGDAYLVSPRIPPSHHHLSRQSFEVDPTF